MKDQIRLAIQEAIVELFVCDGDFEGSILNRMAKITPLEEMVRKKSGIFFPDITLTVLHRIGNVVILEDQSSDKYAVTIKVEV